MTKDTDDKTLQARFYLTESGSNPVRDEIMKLSPEERKTVGEDVKSVEFGWPIGLPVCRDLGKGLREVRSKLRNRIFRVIFGIDNPYMVLLHAFVKKTQKTPPKDLQLAQKRWKTYLDDKKDETK